MTVQNLPNTRDLTRTTLAVLFIGALIASTFWIMRPFLSAILWATMIVISTWPLMLRLQARLWGRRGLATTAMTMLLLLILIIPLSASVGILAGNAGRIVVWIDSLHSFVLPPAPDWVAGLPLVGAKLSAGWQQIAAEGPGALTSRVAPYAGRVLEWFASQVGGLGSMVLQFLLTVIIAAILYVHGETAAGGVRRFAIRLAGSRGEKTVVLAGNSIRGVAAGVVVTAIVQTAIAGAGLAIASIPATMLLSAVILLLCLAQLGPHLIMFPVVIWKFYTGDTLWGSILLVFALVAGLIDNFLRPVLIRKGADLPLLLIFAGVIGGMISLGIMGIFVGPVILAVTHTLLKEWIEDTGTPAPAESAQSAASGA